MQKLLLVCFILNVLSVSAQKIEGTVKDADGNPLPFASILVKGTPMGVTANNHGEYSISLAAGKYTLVCYYVGYTSQGKAVVLNSADEKINFVLTVQKLTLKEVIVKGNGEDPAYEIIRQAIKKRPFYESQVKAFEAQVYIKGLIKFRGIPQRIFGQKIPEENTKELGIDSSGKGIIYLSESVEKVSAQGPDKFKVEVLSSRVSGSNGFGFDFPVFIDFYKNNVSVFASQLNPRGFISPIADGALNYYKYKFLGSYFENGKEINVITVMPKRNYEPLFSGIINITENDWRIYSCNLSLTKESQLQILDTLQISQLFVPVENDLWRIKNQVLHFSFDQLGFKAEGNFVNVYSRYNLHPDFPKDYFNRVVIKYDTGVSKRPHSYWDSIRPVPLEPEEIKDYKTKDSLLDIRNESGKRNVDSLKKVQGRLKVTQVLWSGVDRTHYGSVEDSRIKVNPLIKTLQYNTVEGLVMDPFLVLTKYEKRLDQNLSVLANARYGFNNHHFNPWLGLNFSNNENVETNNIFKRQSYFIAGGKRVSQFFKEDDLDPLTNSISTLLWGTNFLKIYENYFLKSGYSKQWESGTRFLIEGEYEDRLPLNNTTDFVLNKKWQSRLTPNYPVEILDAQFLRHQAVVVHASVSFNPGQKYIQFPKYKMSLGSNYPTFTFDYTKGIKNIFGSDVDYDKVLFNVVGDANFKLAGLIKYNATIGGFLNSKSVFAQDYKHFYTNTSHIAGEYVKAFQNVTLYEFSNTSPFYAELHFEHHSNGLITNKIPLLKKWNWNLVEGINTLYMPSYSNHIVTKYSEVFAGFENILKFFRIDAVMAFQNGYKPVITYRVGFGGLLGDAVNVLRFSRNKKVIDNW